MKQNTNLTTVSLTLGLILFFSFQLQAQTKWTAPASAGSVKNPLAGNPSAAKDGKALYISYCAPCHGDKGKGDGVAAGALNPKPANHSSAAVQSETDGALFWKMSEGKGAMAAYKGSLSEQQRWSLVSFIRTLKK